MLSVPVIIAAVRRPRRVNVDVAILFAAAAITNVLPWIQRLTGEFPNPIGGLLSLTLLLAHPFPLVRVVNDFTQLPRWLLPAGGAFLAVYVLLYASLFSSSSLPTWYALVAVVYFVGLQVFAAVAFVRAARSGHGVTRRRLQFASMGALAAGGLILVAGLRLLAPAWGTVWTVLGDVANAATAAGYYLAFATPAFLRAGWREPELRAFLGRTASWLRQPDTDSVMKDMEQGVADSVGASQAVIALWSEQAGLRTESFGGRAYSFASGERIGGRTFASQQALFADSVDQDPDYAEFYRRAGAQAVMAAPITIGDRRLGALVVFASRPSLFAEDDLALVQLLAKQIGMVLETRDLIDKESRARAQEEALRRMAFLGEVSHVLTSSLDHERALSDLTGLLVSHVAEWCAIHLREPDGRIRILAVAHSDPARVAWAEDLLKRRPFDPNAPRGLAKVLRTGQTEIYPDIRDALLADDAPNREEPELMAGVGPGSALTAPLSIRGEVFGGITLASAESGGRYGAVDQALVEEIARRASLATDNSRLYHDARTLAMDLEHRAAELEAANKELESFSYSVSHDLRAPLRGIDGFSQALLEDCAERVDDEGKRYLNMVRSETQKMGRLIDDMLTLSRVTRSEIHREQIDLSRLAREIAEGLRSQQPEREVEFIVAPDLGAEADRRLLRVVLENLLGNAWKFTSKHPQARIEFGSTQQEGKTVYLVRDNGAGFDMAYAGKLFGAFQRLHPEREFPGTGVGLATVQRVIRRHGGKIWAEGQVQKGATFYFTL